MYGTDVTPEDAALFVFGSDAKFEKRLLELCDQPTESLLAIERKHRVEMIVSLSNLQDFFEIFSSISLGRIPVPVAPPGKKSVDSCDTSGII